MTIIRAPYSLLGFSLAVFYLSVVTPVVGAKKQPSLAHKLLNSVNLRRLDDNQNNGYNYGYYDNEDGIYYLADLTLKYLGCSSYTTGNNNNNNNNGDGDEGGEDDAVYYYDANGNKVYKHDLVRFSLCSSSGCGSCSGEYAMSMVEFLEVYTEFQREERQQQCEYIQQHCYCSSGYYESCLYSCFSNAGVVECMNDYYAENGGGGGKQGSFQLEDYLECSGAYGAGNDENNNNNNNGEIQFYVGPYCASEEIYLGAYYDQYCTNSADASYFMSLNYGSGFPYFYEPIMSSSSSSSGCISCMDPEQQNNNNGDDDGQPEANELCRMATEEAPYKCDYQHGYYSGCTFLNTTLPCLDGRGCPEGESEEDYGGGDSSSSSSSSSGSNHNGMNAPDYYLQMLKDNPEEAIAILGATAVILVMLVVGMCCMCRRGDADQTADKRQAFLGKPTLKDQVMLSRDRSLM